MWDAEPNAAHRALADLERKAALHTIVTQNVDGLHQAAGSSAERIVEIHGNVREVKCLACDWRGPMGPTLDRVRAGETDPRCTECGGILKSATISFGENLVPDDLHRAQQAAARADVFLALGTSLTVYPAAALPEFALANRARLVILNAQVTPFDGHASAISRERLGDRPPRPGGPGLRDALGEYPTAGVGFYPPRHARRHLPGKGPRWPPSASSSPARSSGSPRSIPPRPRRASATPRSSTSASSTSTSRA